MLSFKAAKLQNITLSKMRLFSQFITFTVITVNILVLKVDGTNSQCAKYAACRQKITEADKSCAQFAQAVSGTTLRNTDLTFCKKYTSKLQFLCQDMCQTSSCKRCLDKMKKAVEDCRTFFRFSFPLYENEECNLLEKNMRDLCAIHCGGRCQAENYCQNGGLCIGENKCSCTDNFSGRRCERFRLGTKENPASSAQAIIDAGDNNGSSLYWIKPPGESKAAQTFCDMSYAGGGWMLASYGYVHTTGASSASGSNKAIPNMNYPMGYKWTPDQRDSSSGVISLGSGAVHLARNAKYMIMAAGNNPSTGGIDQYSHIYRIFLGNNPYNITFANHNRYHGATGSGGIPQMHLAKFRVEALKGESGSENRYGLGEALGVSWSDTYPTGYGFNDKKELFSTWDVGPFFPSVHSGDRPGGPCKACGRSESFLPDVTLGSPGYTHRGWYSLRGYGKKGQTSIWFK